jgi:Trk K+ transport system NAD-binding subunit
MIVSSYLIKYTKPIFKKIEPYIKKIDKKILTNNIKIKAINPGCEVIFFGYYDLDRELLEKYREKGKKIAVIENDPEHIAMLKEEGIKCIYGSINNPDFFEQVNFSKVEVAVSSRTDVDENKTIIKEIKKENPQAIVIVSAKKIKDTLTLYRNNADYVIYTDFLNEKKVSKILDESITDLKKIVDERLFDMARLKKKEELSKKIRENGGFYDLENIFKIKKGNKKIKEKEKNTSKEPDKKKIPDEVQEYLDNQQWLYRHGADKELHEQIMREKSSKETEEEKETKQDNKKKDDTKEKEENKKTGDDKEKETRDEVIEFLEKKVW